MLKSIFWKPYSCFLIVGDNANWSIDDDARYLQNQVEKLRIKSHIIKRTPFNIPQIVHYTSQFSLTNNRIYRSKHRISVDYFHGKPDQDESFKRCFEALRKNHQKISAVRVSNKEMETLIKSSGINSAKVSRIPIAVDLEVFQPTTIMGRRSARERFGIPQDAAVIGSFQKDGSGWGEGLEPKWVKGPDIFLKVIEKLKKEIPNLWILLSGPSRGFIKRGLEKIDVPYMHEFPKDSKEISKFYDAIDLYIITSREEGGPKACLDSMAKGIPLVTTEVGQCKDLIKHGENAMMASVDDVGKLYEYSLQMLRDNVARQKLKVSGFISASENSYENQLPLWQEYLSKLIEQ